MIGTNLSLDKGKTWIAGWANPYFTREQLPRLVEHWNGANQKAGIKPEDGGRWLRLDDGEKLFLIDRDNFETVEVVGEDGYWFLGMRYRWLSERVHGDRL